MKYDYNLKITFQPGEPFDVNYILTQLRIFPGRKILVEVANTKGIKSSDIRKLPENIAIRIAGAYDKDRIEKRKDWKFANDETGEYYTTAVIYSRNETIKILEQLESLESGLNKDWSDIQKMIYIYDKLRNNIMYDPKHERKFSSEIRSLRGLVSRETVCAGYAVIFKECMDRLGIKCDYTEGYVHKDRTGGHAWNIVYMNGKMYPIDLTWDNTNFRKGAHNTFEWFTKTPKEFAKKHRPVYDEKIQNYERVLSSFDKDVIQRIYEQLGIGRNKLYSRTTYTATREDGTKFIITHLGNAQFYGKTYYRYYYMDINKDGSFGKPSIYFSGSNLSLLMDSKNFGKPIPPGYEKGFVNVLFSEANLSSSKSKGSHYIGEVNISKVPGEVVVATSPSQISKDPKLMESFNYDTRIGTRSDGTSFVIQKISKNPFEVKGVMLYRYDIFEMDEKSKAPRRNTVFTEMDLFADSRKEVKDVLLSRERLDRKVKEAGGYIGYLDRYGIKNYSSALRDEFTPDKRIDIDANNHIHIQKVVAAHVSPYFSSKSIIK